ncbi:MAG: TonB-dependent receptor [Bacteroidetes bacterium]|nr:TonB-dependent receptor [Bacteroidota bacterium]
MLRIFSILLLLFSTIWTSAQNTGVFGIIKDNNTKELLAGVNVYTSNSHGIATDEKGSFLLSLEPGDHTLYFSYIGYEKISKEITVVKNKLIRLDVELQIQSRLLDEVVVSAGKFEQKISDVTVSMVVVKPQAIQNNNATTLESVVQKIPGVMVVDKQISIRGGSGYSYGAGSRVLLLIDDLPMLTGASGEIVWDYVPLESLEQVEIIKGASSSLFGSSALNGIINIRTAFPKEKAQTKLQISTTLYGSPRRKEIQWWGDTLKFKNNLQFFHSRKLGNLDLIFGASVLSNDGFRQNDNEQNVRFTIGTQYASKKIKGLTFGVKSSFMKERGNLFLLWKDGDTGVYMASPDYDQSFKLSRFNIDPYITFFNNKKTKHSLRTRFYRIQNTNNTYQNNLDKLFYADYKFQFYAKKGLVWTSGLSGSHMQTKSEIFGDTSHSGNNVGIYSQLDKKFDKLTISLGGRWDRFSINEDQPDSKPVFRAGINYHLAQQTYIRASFGQGFRYPTVAEKYTVTQVGSLKIFPNENLSAERGWSAELGLLQAFRIKNWLGYIDFAGFVSEYKDMIEFNFGQHYPPELKNPTLWDFIDYTGFKAFNISNAQIYGIDIVLSGNGMIHKIPINYSLGYTYNKPLDLKFEENKAGYSTDHNILKYRFYHSAKASLSVEHKGLSMGLDADYHSHMINIDKAFEDSIRTPPNPSYPNGIGIGIILPGIKNYREEHNKGDIVFDFFLSYTLKEKHKLLFVIKNLLNREYMIRPGDVREPINYGIQYSIKL